MSLKTVIALTAPKLSPTHKKGQARGAAMNMAKKFLRELDRKEGKA